MQKIIRATRIEDIVGLSLRHCNRLESAGKFPKKIRLGENSTGWLESEVAAWIRQRAAERDAGKSKRS